MSNVDKGLQNDKLKAEIVKRVFPDGDELGCHKFRIGADTCKQCSTKFWDWVVQTPEGLSVKAKLCSVIGLDEVENFRNWE